MRDCVWWVGKCMRVCISTSFRQLFNLDLYWFLGGGGGGGG